jgi:AP-1-like factor
MPPTTTGGLPANFILTPQQQNLLFRALTSNQPAGGPSPNNPSTTSPSDPTQSPLAPGLSGAPGFQESPFQDYYDYDSSFDLGFGNDVSGEMFGDLPGATRKSSDGSSKATSPENENTEKRSHPDEDSAEKEEGDSKRRESDGKVPKKPGRKLLTNEPSSKRKAQNRAAQRAFRERKEQHLKDLETKVQELEKVSETASTENSQLRATIEKMTIELSEYKKKLSLASNPRLAAPQRPAFGSPLVNNMNDVNFQFEFPKFGNLAGQVAGSAANQTQSAISPTNKSGALNRAQDQATSASSKGREHSDSQSRETAHKFPGVFSGSPYDMSGNASRTSIDSGNFSHGGTASNSPSSSHSNGGPSSSCGTSPEPFTQSPLGFKPVDTLTTIGEEQTNMPTTGNAHDLGNFGGSFDFDSIDWLANQNGGQFDPQLFGGYREPQDNILATAGLDDSFFNDAFDADFLTPYNVPPVPPAPKKDICAEIDAQKESDDQVLTSFNGKLLTCNNIWEKLQTCPKVQAGDIDLDGLCSDLQKKAKCGGTGAVVDESDFKAVMQKHLGGEGCPDNTA